jgi:hypothetical protein
MSWYFGHCDEHALVVDPALCELRTNHFLALLVWHHNINSFSPVLYLLRGRRAITGNGMV